MPKIRIPLYVTMAVDPALSASASADFTGITVVGTAPDGSWYVLEADNFKGVPDAVVERVVRHAVVSKPRILSLESVAFSILYRPLLVPRLREAGCSPEMREYRIPTFRSKSQRIEALQPLFKAGKIFIKEGLEELIDQLDRYPEVDHDDLLDSLAQHLDIARPPRAGEVHPATTRDWYDDFSEWGPQDKPPAVVLPSDGTWTGKHGTTTRPLTPPSS